MPSSREEAWRRWEEEYRQAVQRTRNAALYSRWTIPNPTTAPAPPPTPPTEDPSFLSEPTPDQYTISSWLRVPSSSFFGINRDRAAGMSANAAPTTDYVFTWDNPFDNPPPRTPMTTLSLRLQRKYHGWRLQSSNFYFWLLCNDSSLTKEEWKAIYNLCIGTVFGNGVTEAQVLQRYRTDEYTAGWMTLVTSYATRWLRDKSGIPYTECTTCHKHTIKQYGDCPACSPNFCQTCAQHSTRCQCVPCTACQQRALQNDYCFNCNRGHNCCGCQCAQTESGECIRGSSKTWPATHPVDRTLFNSARMAGLEIEYNASADRRVLHRMCKEWGASIHPDGSCGYELVTSPAAGNHLVRQIKDAAWALEKAEAKVDARCGLHVHVDARDFHWSDMQKLLRVWKLVEPAMFILAGQGRYTNSYSAPWGEAVGWQSKKDLAESLWGSNRMSPEYRKDRKNISKKDGARYRSLNIMPWLARLPAVEWYDLRRGEKVHRSRALTEITVDTRDSTGKPVKIKTGQKKWIPKIRQDSTVEFRLHEGVHKKDELLEWTKVCVGLMDYCMTASMAEIEKLPTDAYRALWNMLPGSQEYLLKKLQGWRKSYKLALRTISYRPLDLSAVKGMKWHLERPKKGWALPARPLVGSGGRPPTTTPTGTDTTTSTRTATESISEWPHYLTYLQRRGRSYECEASRGRQGNAERPITGEPPPPAVILSDIENNPRNYDACCNYAAAGHRRNTQRHYYTNGDCTECQRRMAEHVADIEYETALLADATRMNIHPLLLEYARNHREEFRWVADGERPNHFMNNGCILNSNDGTGRCCVSTRIELIQRLEALPNVRN